MDYAMDEIEFCRMSTRGQLVIPESLRKKLNLKAGTVFIVEETSVDSGAPALILTVFRKKV